jgi:hemoglobin
MKTVSKFFAASLVISGVALSVHPAQAQSDKYYQQFGGQPGIKQVVDDFVATVGADPRINGYFAHAHIAHLKYELGQQFCALLNGPCTYTGKDMDSAHKGMNITESAFNALDEDLNTAMDKNNIPIGAQNYLTGKLAPMEQPIVTRNTM